MNKFTTSCEPLCDYDQQYESKSRQNMCKKKYSERKDLPVSKNSDGLQCVVMEGAEEDSFYPTAYGGK
jgi:hypothetical protein